jgi:hypothetical protein
MFSGPFLNFSINLFFDSAQVDYQHLNGSVYHRIRNSAQNRRLAALLGVFAIPRQISVTGFHMIGYACFSDFTDNKRNRSALEPFRSELLKQIKIAQIVICQEILVSSGHGLVPGRNYIALDYPVTRSGCLDSQYVRSFEGRVGIHTNLVNPFIASREKPFGRGKRPEASKSMNRARIASEFIRI